MSKTLFWYIFWNLLRVFVLTTAGLAFIMCFAGLLRPLTENGLEVGQINRMLLYMLPAMCTYSLPVAALFAATMVYGRFSADNELTAMRAGGIGYISLRRFSIALPALVLGLLVAVVSLLMLCFIVPIFSLKVEEVIYSNIARVIASKIEKSHEVEFRDAGGDKPINVFAQSASVPPPDPAHPGLQQVELIGPMVVDFERDDASGGLNVPKEYSMATRAMVNIARSGSGSDATASLTVQLTDGIRFPRVFFGNVQAGVGDTSFGPIEIPSLINENVKFMDVSRLAELATDPGRSDKVKIIVRGLILREQERLYLDAVAGAVNAGTNPANPSRATWYQFTGGGGTLADTYTIGGAGAAAHYIGSELAITAPPDGAQPRTVWMVQKHGSQETLSARSREIRVRAKPDPLNPRMAVSLDMFDTELHTQDVYSERVSYAVALSLPMPAQIQKVSSKTLDDYRVDPQVTPSDAFMLNHEQVVARNAALSELNGRASFAVSCLILVMVGCALGVMFRSGNFLTAFAASFLPALLCITLIVCGQQVATHVPFDKNFHNPLQISLWFIWTGNLGVLVAAIYLTMRLQKR